MANYCCKCGYKVKDDWKYCPVCGAELPIIDKLQDNEQEKTVSIKPQSITIINTTPIIEAKKDLPNHPTIPRKVDPQIFTGRLKEYRLQKAGEEHKSPLYIFENKAIDCLVEARNRILVKQDLFEIKYWAEARIEKYGDDIIDILNQLDQNYIPKK